VFGNMTIGKKIGVGFGAVLVLLGGLSFFSYVGITRMSEKATDAVDKNELIENLTHKEIDHLNWANKVVDLLTDESVTTLDVQTDPHKCGFGKWFYSDARTKAEEAVSGLAPILKEIEPYHDAVHHSALEIEEHFVQADSKLPKALAERISDHLVWASVIRDALLAQGKHLDVQTDAAQCALGKWMASAEGKRALAHGSAEYKAAFERMQKEHKQLHESAVAIGAVLAKGAEGQAEAKKLFDEKTLPLLQQTLKELSVMKGQAEHALDGVRKANDVYLTQTKPNLKKVQELLGEATHKVGDVVEETNRSMVHTARGTKTTVSIVALIAVAAGIVLAVFIARGIVRALKGVINGLTSGAEQVADASGQVAQASEHMAEGASEQASSLEEISSSLEEMASMTKQNADNAKQANTMSESTQGSAEKSQQAMGRLAGAITNIKNSSDETVKIIKTIDEIAFQTNLLALNAAVEAARAGEAGKGFAVVAEEVRNLAQRSAEAARSTASLIEGSQTHAENGVTVSAEVEQTLGEIVEGVQKVAQLIGEVSVASNEQAEGIEQINTAVSQMDKVTQSNAANAEESASASEELSGQAKELNDMVNVLVRLVGGGGRGGAARAGSKAAGSPHEYSPPKGRSKPPSDGGNGDGRAKAAPRAREGVVVGAGSRLSVHPEHVIPLDDNDLKDF